MVAEFKASLMHVLEAICQQTELVLQHYAEMLRTLLPAVCEVRLGDRGLEFSSSFPPAMTRLFTPNWTTCQALPCAYPPPAFSLCPTGHCRSVRERRHAFLLPPDGL